MDEGKQETRQAIEEAGSLSRLGNCLRATFTADNHDSLGDDVTRSLLHLSLEAKAPPMRARPFAASLSLAEEVERG